MVSAGLLMVEKSFSDLTVMAVIDSGEYLQKEENPSYWPQEERIVVSQQYHLMAGDWPMCKEVLPVLLDLILCGLN